MLGSRISYRALTQLSKSICSKNSIKCTYNNHMNRSSSGILSCHLTTSSIKGDDSDEGESNTIIEIEEMDEADNIPNKYKKDFKKPIRKVNKQKSKRDVVQQSRQRMDFHEAKAVELGLPFRIASATMLHRYPVVTPDEQPWELEMRNLQDKIEHIKREQFISMVGGTDSQMIPDDDPEFEEIMETLPFKPASRITEADTNNDRRSLNRKLPNSLYLIVKRNRDDHSWQFPQGKVLDDEKSLRKSSERIIDRAVGTVEKFFISNMPIGHYIYAYPEAIQKQRNQYGTKVFFYRTQLISGTIKLETRLYKDYAWVTRDELHEYFDKESSDLIQAMLPY